MHGNIVSLVAVSGRPFAIMHKPCEFNFCPFNSEHKVSSLDKFLDYYHSENLYGYFLGIKNRVALDLSKTLSHLNKNDIVHRDTKLANI